MKKEKGIGLVAFVIIFAAILIIGAVAVVLVMTKNKEDSNIDEMDSDTKIETSNKSEENTSELQDFLGDIEEQGQQNSQVSIGEYQLAKEEDFTFEDIEGGVKITDYIGNVEVLEVPPTLGGKNVVEIGTESFSKTAIKGIKLPDTVKTISDKAFFYCTLLVEVTLGNGTQTIGDECFEGCMALTKIKLNEGLIKFGYLSFGMCTSLKEIEFPKTLKDIGRGTFCLSGLEKVIIPSNIEIIGYGAFDSCESLKEVVISEGVKTIGEKAFYSSSITSVVIPNTVIEIGSDAFMYCSELASVNIPNSVKTIEHAAFQRIAVGATIYVEDDETKAILEEGAKYIPEECSIVVDPTRFN